jgi:hypothetical protein
MVDYVSKLSTQVVLVCRLEPRHHALPRRAACYSLASANPSAFGVYVNHSEIAASSEVLRHAYMLSSSVQGSFDIF